MGEIPEDIRLEAERIFGELRYDNFSAVLEDIGHDEDLIANAILAERQRCAEVARAYLEDLAGCDLRDDEPDLIASAILKP